MTVSGVLAIKGQGAGHLRIEACRITLAGGGRLVNNDVGGSNRLTAHESMALLAGSEMAAKDGSNELVYRTADKPPLISGVVSPAVVLTLDTALVGCPVCGNAEIDEGETCDDGNVVDGDGCSSLCETE